MQLVLCGNRVVNYGEDCLDLGCGILCPDTEHIHSNCTLVTTCTDLPADIDSVGYEYHAGIFVPCEPYGETVGGNNGWETIGSVSYSTEGYPTNDLILNDKESQNVALTIPYDEAVLDNFSQFRYVIKRGSYFNIRGKNTKSQGLIVFASMSISTNSYTLIKISDSGDYDDYTRTILECDKDIVFHIVNTVNNDQFEFNNNTWEVISTNIPTFLSSDIKVEISVTSGTSSDIGNGLFLCSFTLEVQGKR